MEDLLPKTGYRARIEKAVKNDAGHPINNGIAMQAHHLLSAKGVQLAAMGKRLEALGYDINVLENLVLLPCTLQGACHLKVQLHRGNHTYEDDDHPESYHKRVKMRLEDLKDFIDDCKTCDSQSNKLQKHLDKLSRKMLSDIENFKTPLTSIFKNYKPDSNIGCSNSDTVGASGTMACEVERNHLHQQGDGQKTEDISFKGSVPYKLKVGR